MRILNNHAIDNSDAEIHTLEHRIESTSESVTYTDTTLVKSIDNNDMEQLLKFFYSDHHDDILDVNLHMFQA